MKLWVFGMCAWLTISTLQAQSVTFSRLPASLQLYPRDAQNKATIPITGKIATAGYTRMSLWVYRDNQPYRYQTVALNYSDGVANFAMSADIKAELAEYNFRVYACKSVDSSLVASRNNVVAGDVFLINGQSNASAGVPGYSYQNEYARSFGVYTNNNNYDSYSPQDTLWNYSGQGMAVVGIWGMELQRYIIEKYGIPTCVINGASGGSSIEYNILRNTANPTDFGTAYGRLLYRVQKAGVQHNIKAILWRQGENETSGNAPGYPTNFNTLYNFWKLDYPSAQKIYVFQVNILAFPLENAGKYVRDFQRRTKGLYPNVETIATVGTMNYDGVHYQVDGHKQTATEVFRILARDFYGSADVQNINSANIKQAYYTSAAKNEIALEFDMPIVFPADTVLLKKGVFVTRKMKDYFYLGGKTGLIQSGSASGNTVLLKLNGSFTDTKITYLPTYFSDQYSDYYDGPQLKNPRGMRAFAFYDFPIGDYKDDPKGKEDINIPLPPTAPSVVTTPPAPVTGSPTQADLRVSMDATELYPKVGDEVTLSLVIWNDGQASASNVKAQINLPAGLAFVSSNLLTLQGNTLMATILTIPAAGYQVLSFKAKVKSAGKITTTAEITSSDQSDPDSTPNNGIDNSEDDQVSFSLEAKGETVTIPVTPIIPPISIPTESANLSLLMDATDLMPKVGDEVKITLLLKNTGPSKASGIGLRCELPAGLEFVSSNLMTQNGNLLTAKILSLDNDSNLMMSFVVKVKTEGKWAIKSEITLADQADPNSTPNNSFDNGEDDTKTLVLETKTITIPTQPIIAGCTPKCTPFLISRAK